MRNAARTAGCKTRLPPRPGEPHNRLRSFRTVPALGLEPEEHPRHDAVMLAFGRICRGLLRLEHGAQVRCEPELATGPVLRLTSPQTHHTSFQIDLMPLERLRLGGHPPPGDEAE